MHFLAGARGLSRARHRLMAARRSGGVFGARGGERRASGGGRGAPQALAPRPAVLPSRSSSRASFRPSMPRPHCAPAAAAADGARPSLSVAADAEAAPRPRRHQRYHPRLAHPPLDHLPSSRHRAASCCWRCGAACRSCTSLVVRSSVRSRSGRVMSSCVWVCPIAVISKMLDGSSSFRV